jgi:hypothetical protein
VEAYGISDILKGLFICVALGITSLEFRRESKIRPYPSRHNRESKDPGLAVHKLSG